MKQNIFFRVIVAIAMMLIGWLPSLAHDFEVEGVFYNKTSDNTVDVTYKGDSNSFYSKEYAGDVVIPSSVKHNGTTYSVTSIGKWAFYECPSLTSIEIPNSVTSIGGDAFYYCNSLKTVVFYCPSVSLGSWTKRSSNIDLVFLGGEIKEVHYDFPSSKYITFYVSPSKVEIFRQKFNGYTVKEITTEQIAMYCNSEKVSNEYDVEKSGTVSFSGSGSGTESDPFLIFNPVQLNDVRHSVGHSGVY